MGAFHEQLRRAGVACFPCWIRYDQAKRKWLKGPSIPKDRSWLEQASWPLDDPSNDWSSGVVGCPIPACILVIDVDAYHGTTTDQIDQLLGCRLPWEQAHIQNTPSGGQHYAFQVDWKARQGDSLEGLKGFDTRAEHRGFICAGQGYSPVNHGGVFAFANPEVLPVMPAAARAVLERREHVPAPAQAVDQVSAADVEQALRHIDPGCSRDIWRNVGYAIKAGLGDDGFELFDRWSAGELWPDGVPHNYIANGKGSVADQWPTFNAEGGIGPSTLFYHAMQGGWRPPARLNVAAAFCPGDSTTEPDLSHDGLALEAGQTVFLDCGLFVASMGRWYLWAGDRWRQDDVLRHVTLVREFLRRKSEQVVEWTRYLASVAATAQEAEKIEANGKRAAKALKQNGTVMAVEQLARSNPELSATTDQFDANPELLGVPGGAVDLKSGGLLPANKQDFITRQCSVAPTPAGCPTWHSFLWRIFAGDRELIEFIQRLAGYALTGHTREHKLFFCYGSGRNGKGTFLNTLRDILGDYGKQAPATAFLESYGERHPTDLASLRGARLVVASEIPAGKAWNESIIKDVTGGDKITARFMRQDYFEYTPQFTLIVQGNHLPAIKAVDPAMRARMVLVPFTVHIPESERDVHLAEKLQAEGSAILHWAVQGAVAYLRDGLRIPESVRAASDDYLEAEDTLGDFLEAHVRDAIGARIASSDLYQKFRLWQAHNGVAQPWTQKAFSQAVKERGIKTTRLHGGTRAFLDIEVLG